MSSPFWIARASGSRLPRSPARFSTSRRRPLSAPPGMPRISFVEGRPFAPHGAFRQRRGFCQRPRESCLPARRRPPAPSLPIDAVSTCFVGLLPPPATDPALLPQIVRGVEPPTSTSIIEAPLPGVEPLAALAAGQRPTESPAGYAAVPLVQRRLQATPANLQSSTSRGPPRRGDLPGARPTAATRPERTSALAICKSVLGFRANAICRLAWGWWLDGFRPAYEGRPAADRQGIASVYYYWEGVFHGNRPTSGR